MSSHRPALLLALLVGACAHAAPNIKPSIDPGSIREPGVTVPADTAAVVPPAGRQADRPVLPPRDAYARGWMPLASTGVDQFRRAHPAADGRGVLIAILDSGIDPTVPGLSQTTSGERKILDLRDFSAEGSVPLAKVTPTGDSVLIAGHELRGFGRVVSLNSHGPWYAGSIREVTLGEGPASDLNGNGESEDTLAVIVTRASDGWVLFIDANGDGNLADERPVHDYLVAHETFGWSSGGRPSPLGMAANIEDGPGAPTLDLFFDTSAHGTHVAGIAAGHDLYGVKGFDGVAPGAQLLGLKIANDANGGISVTGAMLRAMDYAIRFAAQRKLSLVMNLSFGVGNEHEGSAQIDALVDSILAAHPDVVFGVAAGNDGPGLSTMSFPGSALRALTVGATFPAAFLAPMGPSTEPLAYFSSRGGEVAKPDLLAPGMAYSSVPRWNTGDERKGGTSMATPHASGVAALLLSAMRQDGTPVEARLIKQAMMVTARPLNGLTLLDEGTGLLDVPAAYGWLRLHPKPPEVLVHATSDGATAAMRWHGLASPGDTLQGFGLVRPPADTLPLEVTLRSDAAWLRAPAGLMLGRGTTELSLRYRAAALARPGAYTGVITGWGRDTLAGPLFRLVNTVVVPVRADSDIDVAPDTIALGGQRRLFFVADSGRPFDVEIRSGSREQTALAYLHEPGGQPYREANGLAAGADSEAAVFQVDGRDARAGVYEATAVGSPIDRATAGFHLAMSPVVPGAERSRAGVTLSYRNVSGRAVSVTPLLVVAGEERRVTVVAHGSAPYHIPFVLPEWAVHATIDVSMEPAQWERLTDFGLSLLDRGGHILGKEPMNYAFGRLNVDLTQAKPAGAAEVLLFPGFAEPAGADRWTADVSIRLYADSSRVVQLGGPEVRVAPGATGTATLEFPVLQFALGDGFFPVALVVAGVDERVWTREVGLPEPTPPLAR